MKSFFPEHWHSVILLCGMAFSTAGYACDIDTIEQAYAQGDYRIVLTQIAACEAAGKLPANLALMGAQAHAHAGTVNRAFDLLDYALAHHPDYSDAYFMKGELLYQQQNFVAADQAYSQCLEIDPANQMAELKQFMSSLLAKDTDRAELLLRKAFLNYKNPHRYFMHAAAAFVNGDHKRGTYLIQVSRPLMESGQYRLFIQPLNAQGWVLAEDLP